jgi:hypothetical protein
VAGDSEFGAIETLKQLEDWYYVMRQESSDLARSSQRPQQQWRALGGVDRAKRRKSMVGGCPVEPLTLPPDESNALLEEGRKEAWLLTPNLPSFKEAL